MYLKLKKPILHWNYFISIEEELLTTSKYVEFDLNNQNTFSTVFTKIILSACSEVDVLLSQMYKFFIKTKSKIKDKPCFKDYFKIIKEYVSTLISEKLIIEQYGIEISPFEEWTVKNELSWHKVYNNLKHKRGKYFKEGNLQNAFLSVGALFTTVIHYYKCLSLKQHPKNKILIADVINSLIPKAKIVKYSNSLHNCINLS